MRARLALLAVLCSCTPKTPAKEAPLAARVSSRLANIDPDVMLVTKDPHTIEATINKQTFTISLDNTERTCADKAACEGAIRSLEKTFRTVVDGAKNGEKPIDPAAVRLTVKDDAWLAAGHQQLMQSPAERRAGNELVSRHLVGPLSIVYVVDMEAGIRVMRKVDMESLHLQPETLDALARKNLLAAHPTVKMDALGTTGVWTNEGADTYDSAMIAFPELWAPLAKTIGTPLWVTVPSRDRVFAANGKTGAARLATVTKMALEQEDHPVSGVVLVWSPEGFTAK